MKNSTILLSLIVNITLVYSQSNEITVLNVDEDVLVFSQSTLDTLALNGLQIKIDQYTNISDWNDDGLNDIILNIASEDTITAYVALFKRQDTNGELQFVEDPNYLMNAKGRVANFESTAGDINEDGLLDIVIVTENYHGPQGQQPPYYLGGEFTPDKLFINNGQGFNYFELDTTMRYMNGIWQYWGSNGGQIFDWDLDGDLEVLISEPNYARIREGNNPEYNKLFSSFDINSNDSISREFVFEWPLGEWLGEQWIHTDLRLFKTINDTLYLAHYNTVGWDTLDSVFVDQSLIDNGRYISENQYEVLIFDINQSFGINGLIDSVVLVSDKRGGFVVDKGYDVSDIDNDGKMEFLTYWFLETDQIQENYLRIFDDDGIDITEQWMPIEWFDDPRTGGDGFTVIDLNNDGFDDILPRNGWNETNEQGGYISFGLFLNDSGNRYVLYYVDFRSGFNHPIDINNDGKYEILSIVNNQQEGISNVDITMLDYNFTIGAPTFDIEYNDQTINEDDTLQVILLASDIDEDVITFTVESDTSAVQTIVTDSILTLIPADNWNGSSTIMVVVSDGLLSDTIFFVLFVTPVNDTPELATALPDVTIDEDDFGAVIIPAIEVYFSDVDEGDILTYMGSALGAGLDSLSISTDEGFAVMGRMANYHGAKVMTIKRSEQKKRLNTKVFASQQTDRDKSGQQGIMSVNIVDDIMDTHQNRSTSRTDSTALIVYPTENFVGDVEIRIVASDTSGASVADTLKLTIENINDTPIISTIADTTIDEDAAIEIVLTASDIDEDALTFTASADTSAVTVAVSTDTLSLSLAENWNGSSTIMVVVSDGSATDTTSFELTVNAVNDAPSSFALNEQDSVYITMANFDSDSITFTWDESIDVDGDELLYDFTASLIVNGQVKAEYISSSLTIREMKIDHQSVFDEIFAAQAMLAGIEWDVSVTDGIEEVMSENGALTLGVNASAAVLSINGELLPDVFALHQNYPNPFNPVTTLRYDLPENGHVNIIIYDMLGRRVKTLMDQTQDAGYRSIIWDATNDYGKPVSVGIYLYQIQAGEYMQTKKMVLLK